MAAAQEETQEGILTIFTTSIFSFETITKGPQHFITRQRVPY